MSGVIAAAEAVSDWSYGGSILTFLFPMILFFFVCAALLVLLTKPHVVPGHRYQMSGEGTVKKAEGSREAPGPEGKAGAAGQGPEGK